MCEENDKNFQGFLLRRIATDTMRLSGWFTNIYIVISLLEEKNNFFFAAEAHHQYSSYYWILFFAKKKKNWKIVQQVNLSFEFDNSLLKAFKVNKYI